MKYTLSHTVGIAIMFAVCMLNFQFGPAQTMPPLPPPPTPTPVPTPAAPPRPKNKPIKYSTKVADKENKSSISFRETPPGYQGFDEWPSPRWLSVRTGATGKASTFIQKGSYAKGLAVVSTTPSIAKISNPTNADEFEFVDVATDAAGAVATTYDVKGGSAGQTTIKAMRTGNKGERSVEINRLNVEVRNRKELTLDFVFVEDQGGHKASAEYENIDGILSGINAILEVQANLKFKKGKAEMVLLSTNTATYGPAQEAEVRSQVAALNLTGDRIAVLTWRLLLADGSQPAGYAYYFDRLVTSGVFGNLRNSDVLAHELGHSLGLVHQPRDKPAADQPPFTAEEFEYSDMVMFPMSYGGQRLRKAEIQHLNPLNP